MAWRPTTDDDFPKEEVADAAFTAMNGFGAGQTELSGYRYEDDDRKEWTVAVAGGSSDVVAIHVDWESQEIVTAWLTREVA